MKKNRILFEIGIAWWNYCNAGRKWNLRVSCMRKSFWQWFNPKHHIALWSVLIFGINKYVVAKDGKYYHKTEAWIRDLFHTSKISSV